MGGLGHAPHWEIFWTLTLKSPGFLNHSERILARFQLGKFFLVKYILSFKNLTDFRWKPMRIHACLYLFDTVFIRLTALGAY